MNTQDTSSSEISEREQDSVPLKTAFPTSPNSNGRTSLKKEFTVLSGVGIIAGNIIGSGIFITPRKIFFNTGSFGLTLIAWVIGGLIALAGGLCYIELGVVVRKSGGEYPIIRTAYSFKDRHKRFGRVLSFLYLWSSLVVVRTVGAAIALLTCATYLSRPFYLNSPVPSSLVSALALTVLGKHTFHTHTRTPLSHTYTPTHPSHIHTHPTPHTCTHTTIF